MQKTLAEQPHAIPTGHDRGGNVFFSRFLRNLRHSTSDLNISTTRPPVFKPGSKLTALFQI